MTSPSTRRRWARLLAAMGVPVSGTLVDDVVSRTEGWPVGVRLAGLASIAPPG